MAGKFLHAVNLEEEREALLNCIEGYKYFLSNPNTYFYEKAYYSNCSRSNYLCTCVFLLSKHYGSTKIYRNQTTEI